MSKRELNRLDVLVRMDSDTVAAAACLMNVIATAVRHPSPKLAERHDLEVSRETLLNWMCQAGIWMARAERKRIQQPRYRRTGKRSAATE